eukprot:5485714-Pyramimonas_sp.AAC.1
MPDPLKFYISLLYINVMCFGALAGQVLELFLVTSGIIQGCPGSGSLFSLAVDPFLQKFRAVTDACNKGRTRACADDIGMTIRDLRHLRRIHTVFKEAEAIARLKLKPAKCVLVPLGSVLTDILATRIKNWLRLNIPDWSDFRVAPLAKYLGLWIGPSADYDSWASPQLKYFHRCSGVARLGASTEVSARTYNRRCVTVLSYVAQFLHLPPALLGREFVQFSKIFHMPHNRLKHSDWMNLEKCGGPRLTSMQALSLASLMRASLYTFDAWRSAMQELRETADLCLPLPEVSRGCLSPDFWKSQPIALTLEQASKGFPEHPKFGPPCQVALRTLKQAHRDRPEVHDKALHPQRILYRTIREKLYPDSLHLTFEKRLRKWCPDYVQEIAQIDWQQFRVVMASLPPSWRSAVLKTLSGGWCTDSSFQTQSR